MNTEKRDFKEEKLDRASAIPLGKQLETIIRDKIASGEWAANTMIPSESQLCSIYGISRMTVRNVITQFVSHGYLYRIQGKGTFVCEKKHEIASLQYSGLRKQLEEQGHSVLTKLISCNRIPADKYLAEKLRINIGDLVFEIKRVRAANNVPLSYHESYVPVEFCPGLEKKDLQGEQLCEILSMDYQVQRRYVTETLESFSADKSKAKYLNVRVGSPLILLQDILFSDGSDGGKPYEFSCVYFRGDMIKIHMEFHE